MAITCGAEGWPPRVRPRGVPVGVGSRSSTGASPSEGRSCDLPRQPVPRGLRPRRRARLGGSPPRRAPAPRRSRPRRPASSGPRPRRRVLVRPRRRAHVRHRGSASGSLGSGVGFLGPPPLLRAGSLRRLRPRGRPPGKWLPVSALRPFLGRRRRLLLGGRLRLGGGLPVSNPLRQSLSLPRGPRFRPKALLLHGLAVGSRPSAASFTAASFGLRESYQR